MLIGFINAAAIIIGLSQLPTILGISVSQSNHFLLDTWRVISRHRPLHEIRSLRVVACSCLSASEFAPTPGVLVTVAFLTLTSYDGYDEIGGR